MDSNSLTSVKDKLSALPQWPAQPSTPLRIVVIDNDCQAAQELASGLKRLGHEVRCALQGVDGLVVAEELRPNMAVFETGAVGHRDYLTAARVRFRPWANPIAIVGHTLFQRRPLMHADLFDYQLEGRVDAERLMRVYAHLRDLHEYTPQLYVQECWV
jgi:hypothetical protein